MELLAILIRQEKEKKSFWIGNEKAKRSLLTDNMMIYIDNLEECIEQLLELIRVLYKDTKLWESKKRERERERYFFNILVANNETNFNESHKHKIFKYKFNKRCAKPLELML